MSLPLDPGLVFERLLIGPGNQLAVAAARRAAEAPGRSYNPLVVVGGRGVGKTHLLVAVAFLARDRDPEIVVRFESGESLVDRVSESVAAGRIDALRGAAAGVGLWLLDDVQELAGRSRTQEEVLRACEAMVARGAQIVASADRPLAEIPGLDPRLASRLGAGLTVELAPPDEVPASAGEARADSDEFGGFLADISTAVAAKVEDAPWKRRLAEAILRWEGEGIRARRLEAALDADTAPDVESLLHAFARDVARMRELARRLATPAPDPALVLDPDRLGELERLASDFQQPGAGELPEARSGKREAPAPVELDPWFLDRSRFEWEWASLDERIVEERR